MKIGLNFFPVTPADRKSANEYYSEALRLAVIADRAGLDHVQTVEHYGSTYGGYSPDPSLLLSAIASRTDRIRVTTGAVIPAFEHPLKMASRLSMLDNLSGGRLDVGFGRGFLPDEFDWYGVDMDDSRDRFNEGVSTCKALWERSDVIVDGKFHSFGPVTIQPRPLQSPHPRIFIASASDPASCIAAGKNGHHLQVVPSIVTPETLIEMISGFYKYAQVGAEVQVKYTCYIDPVREAARHRAEILEKNYIDQMASAIASWGDRRSLVYKGYEKLIQKVQAFSLDAAIANNKVLVGTPDEVNEQISSIKSQLGENLTLSLQVNPGYQDYATSEATLNHVIDEILPAHV